MSEQQPKEYIITEEQLKKYEGLFVLDDDAQQDFQTIRSRPAPASSPALAQQPPKFNSTELILLAHDEWKRREERKHNHPEDHWATGFIAGFCTSRSWARRYVDVLLQAEVP